MGVFIAGSHIYSESSRASSVNRASPNLGPDAFPCPIFLSLTMASPLYAIPLEIAEQILMFSHPRDVARISQTCRQFHVLVYKADQYLWRELFLSYPFDHPKRSYRFTSQQIKDFDWKEELQRRVKAEIYISSGKEGPELQESLLTLHSAVATAADLTDSHQESYNIAWLSKLFHTASFLHSSTLEPSLRSLRAQLHSYLALSYDETPLAQSPTLRALRLQSRCYVYDLRNYTRKTLWGPFIIDPNTNELIANWEHIDHIVNVVIFNIRNLEDSPFQEACPKWNLEMTRAYSAPRSSERKPHDWAGAEGTWRRFISFMDYRELFAFNYSSFGDGPRDQGYFQDDTIEEAVRVVEMRLKLVDNPTIAPEPFDDPEYPPLMYEGVARGMHSANADIKGVVRKYLNGTIRWTFLMFYEGVRQWSAEGVQVGNVCSASGIAGIWTGSEHQVGDPAGPFLMWRVADALMFNEHKE
ncbi:unnamed protein product [Somion occarium]|uniref:F-box domain-containing protein n=1 Tax=Somion occarium TaxID=3059160 RepID=A0ABP1CKG1_9APHY